MNVNRTATMTRAQMIRLSVRSMLLTAILIFTATAVWGGDEKLASDLRGSRPQSNIDVIVRYRGAPTEANHQKVLQAGGALRHRLDFIRSAHYSVSPALLKSLADDADVEYITPDRAVHGTLNITSGTVYSTAANAAGWTGKGVGVAVIDSGIADVSDFQNGWNDRIVYAQSFVPSAAASNYWSNQTTSANDQYGHGTHVAGIVGADGNGSVYIGMAPGANLINLKVLDQNGSGTDSLVIAAINQAIQLQNKYNIRIINLSLGRPVYESSANDPLCQAVEAAWNAGIVVVAAAGNDGRDNSGGTQGYGTITAPGNDPYVITVGAMNSMGTTTRADDVMTSYSSKGPTAIDHYAKPDIVAPGNLIASVLAPGSTLLQEYPQNQVGSHFVLSGTSMATPVVSGAAALLLQQTPSLSPDQVKARLMRTATKNFPQSSVISDPVTQQSFTVSYDLFTIGAGYLNITAALNDNTVAYGSAVSPTAVYNPSTGQVSLQGVNGQTVVWGSTVVWGTNVVWGTTVVWGTNVVWGTTVVWGTNVVWGTTVVWGTSSAVSDEASTLIYGEPF